MNKIHLFPLLILFACLLVTCDSAPQTSDLPPLEPGDMLGEMAIVSVTSPAPHVTDYCAQEELQSGDCKVPKIGHIGIMNGWDEDSIAALEEAWACCSWDLIVDGRRVDVNAFLIETIENEDRVVRFWNVALKSPTPGKHTVRWTYGVEELIEETWIFTVAENAGFDQ